MLLRGQRPTKYDRQSDSDLEDPRKGRKSGKLSGKGARSSAQSRSRRAQVEKVTVESDAPDDEETQPRARAARTPMKPQSRRARVEESDASDDEEPELPVSRIEQRLLAEQVAPGETYSPRDKKKHYNVCIPRLPQSFAVTNKAKKTHRTSSLVSYATVWASNSCIMSSPQIL